MSDTLRQRVRDLSPAEKLSAITDALCAVLHEALSGSVEVSPSSVLSDLNPEWEYRGSGKEEVRVQDALSREAWVKYFSLRTPNSDKKSL